ncbi:hypothetical protein CBI38_34330 (plasmid) [Rhodococcus oxybenzonivorans]|uniref:Uncharacterized protein n=1 Tax=Rhodococcus oxybenzonivorans TaxID=1990687 RepID=A0A2S2C6I1_9NOCA|nr:hypothetical protein CBI38_34330 [Rhodococcus oxybenzonivorans]
MRRQVAGFPTAARDAFRAAEELARNLEEYETRGVCVSRLVRRNLAAAVDLIGRWGAQRRT